MGDDGEMMSMDRSDFYLLDGDCFSLRLPHVVTSWGNIFQIFDKMSW